MNIQEFQKQVKRTFPDLGSVLLNSIHCVLGMGSELNEEVVSATLSGDKINLGEELGDAQWYIANYANVHGFQLPEKIQIINPTHATSEEEGQYMTGLLIQLGKLQDFDKRLLAYENDTDVSVRKEAVMNLLASIEFIACVEEINMDEFRQKVIDKLLLRYPIADGFTVEKAINRDLTSERSVLEGKVAA